MNEQHNNPIVSTVSDKISISDFINSNLDWFDLDEVDQLIIDGLVCCGSFDSESCKCPSNG